MAIKPEDPGEWLSSANWDGSPQCAVCGKHLLINGTGTVHRYGGAYYCREHNPGPDPHQHKPDNNK